MDNLDTDYTYRSAERGWSDEYLWPPLCRLLDEALQQGDRIMDVGCGNGATAGMLSGRGFDVTGVDPSVSGIQQAVGAYPDTCFRVRSAYDDLANEFGKFQCVISLEVVEHCFWPRKLAANMHRLLTPGGIAIISTPYHGYFKNLALALTNRFDQHWSPLWDGGHIKFWSIATLGQLLVEAGFSTTSFKRVGRIPPLAKSMIVAARKPVE